MNNHIKLDSQEDEDTKQYLQNSDSNPTNIKNIDFLAKLIYLLGGILFAIIFYLILNQSAYLVKKNYVTNLKIKLTKQNGKQQKILETNQKQEIPQKLDFESILTAKVISSHITHKIKDFYAMEKKYYTEKYNIADYEEKPFCVVVPTYNNQENSRCISNIQTILNQQYQNYKVVIIDDASSDRTPVMIEEYLEGKEANLRNKVTLIKNKKNTKALYNLFWAAHNFCNSEDIMTVVDGDDFLIGKQVLKFFNAVYQKEDLWFVYSNFMMIDGAIGYSGAYSEHTSQHRRFRSTPSFLLSHQHTFYTELFRRVKQEDLKDENGEWFTTAYDLAIYFPMAQMASNSHIRYIPELTYFYNSDTGQNDYNLYSQNQLSNDLMLRTKIPYEQLSNIF